MFAGMDLEEELAQLDAEIEQAQISLVRQQADLDALRARRDSLRRSVAELRRLKAEHDRASVPAGESGQIVRFPSSNPTSWEDMDLSRHQRTDAIAEILERSSEPMRISEVIEALNAATREHHEYQVVASTLAFLARTGRISNVSRGLYGSSNFGTKEATND
jgi:hypothetical protein